MAFQRPTLAELIERAASDIEAELPGSDARLRRSNLGAIARVSAAAVHGLYGYLAYIARQILPDTADADHLVRWAAMWGITRLGAGYAAGAATVTGTTGRVVDAGTELQRADGTLYQTVGSVTLVDGAATLTVQARTAGVTGNCASGTKLTFSTPVAGVNSQAVVAGAIDNGTDVESDDALRARVIERMQAPPAGGTAADYVAWAKEVEGVTRAWCFPLEDGPGTVVVRFVRDGESPINPSEVERDAVQTYLDSVRPVTATVTVKPTTLLAQAFNIAVTPDTTAVRAAVQAELESLMKRDAKPGGRIYLSRIREAVSIAAGESDSTVLSPTADIVPATGAMVTVGTITWS